MTINQPVLRKWIDALRSGKYTQTTGMLGEINDNGTRSYCCLGVLCEIAAQEGITEPKESANAISYDGVNTMPPGSVVRWFDPGNNFADYTWTIPRDQNKYPIEAGNCSEDNCSLCGDTQGVIGLSELNDTHKVPFTDIADAIEAAWGIDPLAEWEKELLAEQEMISV